MNIKPRVLLAISVASILLLTLAPIHGYHGHAHWERVQWVPFGERQLPARQAIANVALFVPFGWGLTRMLPRRWALALALAAGALLSTSVEAAQVFAHGRYPTATDVALNVLGAGVGAWLARRP